MSEILIEAIKDTVKDTATLVPTLLVTYLAMEWLESRTEGQSTALMSRVGKSGCILGAGIGLIPQCGFAAASASLYSGGVITLGTMLAVFLSTSDEMLPIFLSSMVAPASIGKVLLAKFAIACASGIAVDAALRLSEYKLHHKHIHDLCEQDNCGCDDEEGGIFRSAAVHTVKITIFIFIVSLVLSIIVAVLGKDAVASLATSAPVIGTLVCGLIGLIPNCAASVVIAELYLEGMLTAGQMMAGLLVGAGVGILVLLRTNRHRGENIRIIGLLYAIGVAWGILLDLIGVTF